jgi:hypothetical protein
MYAVGDRVEVTLESGTKCEGIVMYNGEIAGNAKSSQCFPMPLDGTLPIAIQLTVVSSPSLQSTTVLACEIAHPPPPLIQEENMSGSGFSWIVH